MMILASFVTTLLATLFLIVCILLIVIVLLQKGRGGGLSAAFGGMGSSAFGTRTGDVFTWVTIILVFFFLVLSIATSKAFRPEEKTVETPYFIPNRAVIEKAVPVTMKVNTPKADIYYTVSTIDEKGRLVEPPDPTRRSLKVDAPIRVAPDSIVRARAVLPGWKDSAVARHEYFSPARAAQTQPAGTQPGATTQGSPTTVPAPADAPAATTRPGTQE